MKSGKPDKLPADVRDPKHDKNNRFVTKATVDLDEEEKDEEKNDERLVTKSEKITNNHKNSGSEIKFDFKKDNLSQ